MFFRAHPLKLGGNHQKLREKPPFQTIATKNPEGNNFFIKTFQQSNLLYLPEVLFPHKKCAPHMRSIFCQSVGHQIGELVVLFVSLSQTTCSSSIFQMQSGNVTTLENKTLDQPLYQFFSNFGISQNQEPHLFQPRRLLRERSSHLGARGLPAST